jgi:hypothetical protein
MIVVPYCLITEMVQYCTATRNTEPEIEGGGVLSWARGDEVSFDAKTELWDTSKQRASVHLEFAGYAGQHNSAKLDTRRRVAGRVERRRATAPG